MANGDSRGHKPITKTLSGTGASLNGYKIRSWGDLIAVASILAMLLSAVAWGLKLESEINTVRSSYGDRISLLEARVADGILPRSEERIERNRADLSRIDKRIDTLEKIIDGHVGNDRHTIRSKTN